MKENVLTLVSLNVERSRHLDRVLPFLREAQPDVCCIQEISQADISAFEEALNSKGIFVPMMHYEKDGEQSVIGLGLFSKTPFKNRRVKYYAGDDDSLPQFVKGDENSYDRMLISCDVEKGGEIFRIGTTHFTWTPDGETDEIQRRDIVKLLTILEREGDIVFTGDFNAPREREIFSMIAAKYKDNVPPHHTSSIDGTLHRAGPIPFMVDGFFSSEAYAVSNVRMICGLSDHCALAGTISHVSKS